MDAQGSELLVLQGSIDILKNFTYIKTEMADFESYKEFCQLVDIESFMKNHGYVEFSRNMFASRKAERENYLDIVYKKKD